MSTLNRRNLFSEHPYISFFLLGGTGLSQTNQTSLTDLFGRDVSSETVASGKDVFFLSDSLV